MDEDTESFDNSVLMSPVMTADDAATLDAMSSHNSVMSLDSICDVPQENMQSNIESIHREKEANEPPYATREAFKEALKRRKPEPNDDGFIPAALAIRECDEINDPRPAKKFFQECCAEGILEAFEVTNRGCFFKYPASVPGQTKLNLQVVA